MGKFSERKLTSSSGAFPEIALFIMDRAFSEDSNGKKA